MQHSAWLVCVGVNPDDRNEILDISETKEEAMRFAKEELFWQKNENKNEKWVMCKNTRDEVQWNNGNDYLTCIKYKVEFV
jgi:hypothetical protein